MELRGTQEELIIPIQGAPLSGELVIPRYAEGLVLFAHGSGSSRKSTRNRFVARALQARGLATLLFDLLTAEEERRDVLDARLRFDIDLLGRRLGEATDWVGEQGLARGLSFGYFGASTGAAAALRAAAQRPNTVHAIVSRGGRPDLATDALPLVRAPTLLIVGGEDSAVLGLNREAMGRMTSPKQLVIVPGATHLFEEPGALEEVARWAGDWFQRHLRRGLPA